VLRDTAARWIGKARWIGLLLAAAALAVAGCGAREPLSRPSVLLITLDTTRADHLGMYGAARPTSPRLDELSRESAVYERAYAPSTWTLPSHASLFTGKYPKSHGARYDENGPLVLGDAIAGPANWKRIRARSLASGERTLAGLLGAAGYRTGAVVGGPWMKRVFGLDRGFEHYDDSGIERLNGRLAGSVTDAAIAWVESLHGQPFLLFLNYYDPHTPFNPPSGFVSAVASPEERPHGAARNQRELDILYDAEIRYMDSQIGRLLDRLRELGLYRDLWIIVTADHGELLGEHGLTGHGRTLYEGELRVPLLVKPSRGDAPTGRLRERVQLTDLFPMILQRVGVAVPADTQGVFPRGDRPAIAEVDPVPDAGPATNWRAILDGDEKFLESSAGDRLLFDLARDPAEAHELAAERPERASALARVLASSFAALPEAPAAGLEARSVDAETQRALESLGYLKAPEAGRAAQPQP